MPSPYTSRPSIDDSLILAENLGVETRLIPITPIYQSYRQALQEPLELGEIEVTLENIQARIRGNILMAISNKDGHMVLSTGNKSETGGGLLHPLRGYERRALRPGRRAQDHGL